MSTTSAGVGVRSIGGLLPAEFLLRLRDPKTDLGGIRPSDYHLGTNERISEIISRSWNRLANAWIGFSKALEELSDQEVSAGALTREKWLSLIFSELGYGRLPSAKSIEIEGRLYPVSHEWGHIPIHLVGARVPLDKRTPGVKGAAGKSPHSLVQELLNQPAERLWGMVSNGLILRVLRDSTSLTRQSYLEFDLEEIFSNELFDDFVTLWMICHESRFEGDDLTRCWLERWRGQINESGIRALDALQDGVKQAIESIGEGLLGHSENRILRESLRMGELSNLEFYREILRLIYRILFLFVAEDRELLHASDAPQRAVERYRRWYSTKRLREQAWGAQSNNHDDLWQMMLAVMGGLGKPEGLPDLGLSALGSYLWSDAAIPDLITCAIGNRSFGAALVHLSSTISEGVRRRVDFANLGAEELGSVYEALLELVPEVDTDAASFALRAAPGNERKTSGSYYTPSELVASLLESALDPIIDEALQAGDPERALLGIKVLDPACGSGHFLIAAAHRIAERLAGHRVGEPEAPPLAVHHALREVISRCCYGIDINPMAVELTKVSLWMEAMEPGKPLTFLERHVVTGNALLGTTPALIASGIPDKAYTPLDGDDRASATAAKKRNLVFRKGQVSLDSESLFRSADALHDEVVEIDEIEENSLGDIEVKAQLWEEIQTQDTFAREKLAADAWCAAFFYEKVPQGGEITTDSIHRILTTGRAGVGPRERELIESLGTQNKFLHLHIAFPEVFQAGDDNQSTATTTGLRGGFDVVLGNPPWNKLKLVEKEFFASSAPEIAAAKGNTRKQMIQALAAKDHVLFDAYQVALRQAIRSSKFLISSGRYPLTGHGDVNSYAVFAEFMRQALAPRGSCGVIVPTGIATDDSTSEFFKDLVTTRSLVSLYDFENSVPLFTGVHRSYKFCLLTSSGPDRPTEMAQFVLFAHQVAELDDPDRRVTLSDADFELINPNTGNLPIFRTMRDAELAKQVYSRVPVLLRAGSKAANPWGVSFRRLFDMTNDSASFRTVGSLLASGATLDGNVFASDDGVRYLPLYEGKLIHHFDHRFATYEGASGDNTIEIDGARKVDPSWAIMPRYWVSEGEVREKLEGWDREWLIGFRGVARSTDERTLIASVLPLSAIGNSLPILLIDNARGTTISSLLGCLCSFALDAIAGMKIGGPNLNFFIIQQLPVLPPDVFDDRVPWRGDRSETLAQWISSRVLELTYTAWDLRPWAKELGYHGEPFIWDELRREQLRAELDACFFHLYGYSRDQVEHAMESFPIIKRRDEKQFGEYRTKRQILELFEEYSS
ncbi:N-6 DNA methylase [Ferrimicrobium sp.]|uniref:Eco57I restriction-modification methylase domain-containing protein n=1 Tax=Ferrimicrobium sp. TaxID=2926050 RepID=UPI00261ECF1D|nr:N-6 DNA methylase [Ferrimicrobium sp.]